MQARACPASVASALGMTLAAPPQIMYAGRQEWDLHLRRPEPDNYFRCLFPIIPGVPGTGQGAPLWCG